MNVVIKSHVNIVSKKALCLLSIILFASNIAAGQKTSWWGWLGSTAAVGSAAAGTTLLAANIATNRLPDTVFAGVLDRGGSMLSLDVSSDASAWIAGGLIAAGALYGAYSVTSQIFSTISTQIADLKTQNNQLHQRVSKLEQKNESLKLQVLHVQQEFTGVKEDTKAIRADTQKITKQVEAVSQDLNKLKEDLLGALKDQANKIQADLQAVEKNIIADLERRDTAASERFEAFLKASKASEERIKEHQSAQTDILLKSLASKTDIQTLSAQQTALQQQLSEQQNTIQNMLKFLESDPDAQEAVENLEALREEVKRTEDKAAAVQNASDNQIVAIAKQLAPPVSSNIFFAGSRIISPWGALGN